VLRRSAGTLSYELPAGSRHRGHCPHCPRSHKPARTGRAIALAPRVSPTTAMSAANAVEGDARSRTPIAALPRSQWKGYEPPLATPGPAPVLGSQAASSKGPPNQSRKAYVALAGATSRYRRSSIQFPEAAHGPRAEGSIRLTIRHVTRLCGSGATLKVGRTVLHTSRSQAKRKRPACPHHQVTEGEY
jgi:hypothetical protein